MLEKCFLLLFFFSFAKIKVHKIRHKKLFILNCVFISCNPALFPSFTRSLFLSLFCTAYHFIEFCALGQQLGNSRECFDRVRCLKRLSLDNFWQNFKFSHRVIFNLLMWNPHQHDTRTGRILKQCTNKQVESRRCFLSQIICTPPLNVIFLYTLTL